MSVVAVESYCMKTDMTHLVDKSEFILSDHKKLQIFAVILVEFANFENCDISCTKLALQKVSVSLKYKSSQEISSKLC